MHHADTPHTPQLSIGDALHDFKEGIKKPNLSNYKSTLQAGLDLIQQTTSEHSYPILQGIFNDYKDYNDLISKVEIYFCTNTRFKYYRYSRYDKNYLEDFNLDFSKHDIRSLLILIRCYNISQGDVSKDVTDLIEAYQYIDANKENKSFESLKKELPGISPKYIEKRYKDKKYTISKGGELAKMIKANLYLLSYDHEGFTQSKKDGRIYNSFSSGLNKVYRENELAFQLGEFDISSANPQIIDKIFEFNNWRNVYSNLQKAYGISRSQAKVKFNATINSHKKSNILFNEVKQVYLNSGYSEGEASQLANFTKPSTRGDIFRLMARKEGEIINQFIDANFKNIPCIRLHDAVYYEPEFYELADVQYNGVSFGHNSISKEHLRLNLKLNTYKTVLTTPPEAKPGIIWKQYFNKDQAKKIYFGENFTFYNRSFEVLSATFNINKPIVKNKEYRTPSEDEFLQRLKRLYITLYFLNEDEGVFYKCIEHMHDQKGIDFNKNYVYEYFKTYTFKGDEIESFIKKRDWIYTGSGIIDNVKIFNEIYHRERRESVNQTDRGKLISDIQKLKYSLKNNQLHHINKNQYYYAHRYDSGVIIDQINELIGVCRIDGVMAFNQGVSDILHTILNNANIGCKISDTPIRKLMREANLSQRIATKIKTILSKKSDILAKLENAIQNLKADITNNIFDPMEPQKNNPVPTISAEEAFDYPIQYNGCVFDITSKEAILHPEQFFVEFDNYMRMRGIMACGAKRGFTAQYDKEKPTRNNRIRDFYRNHHLEHMADAS